MKKSWHIERRTFLKGAGACIALPYLNAMTTTKKPTLPKRFCGIYFPYGVSMPPENSPDKEWGWFPTGKGRKFTFNKPLKSLEDIRHKLSIIGGMSHVSARHSGGHESGNFFLTGYKHVPKHGNSISLDQYLVDHLGNDTFFSNINLAVDPGISSGSNQTRTISFNKKGQGIASIANLTQIYNMLFSEKHRKHSLVNDINSLDKVLDHSKYLSKKLGKNDQEKLQEYMDSIRSIEKKINRSKKWLKVSLPHVDKKNFNLELIAGESDAEEYYNCLYDLLALALQSDRTRIATFMTGSNHSVISVANKLFTNKLSKFGTYNHHQLAHGKDYQMHGRWDKLLTQQFHRFLKKLDAMKEESSSVLDRTIVLYGSANSVTHVHKNYPLILAGGSKFNIKHNKYIHYTKEQPMSNLLLGIIQKFGIKETRFAESKNNAPELFS